MDGLIVSTSIVFSGAYGRHVICSVSGNRLIVIILKIGHRKGVYR